MDVPRLADLKAQAQEHYTERLDWVTCSEFGGSAWADVDHHTVSVMCDPPGDNPHIAVIRGGRQYPLDPAPTTDLDAVQLALTF